MTLTFFTNSLIFFLSFLFIWFGSGLIIKNVSRFSRLLRISSFSISFFLLGFLTSIPELTVGVNAIFDNKPEIFVGNLIGGIMVIFSFIIPLLAIINRSISLRYNLENKNLIIVLLYLLLPLTFIADQKLNLIEAIFLVFYYFVIFYLLEKKQTLLEKITSQLTNHKKAFFIDIVKIAIGVVIVIISSHFIVEKALFFSSFFNVSPFFVGLLIISIGTNLPELSLVIRSFKEKKQEIAFGDYLGSATANIFILGLLAILNQSTIVIPDHFYRYAIFIALALILFYIFIRSENKLSAKEGLILFFLYCFYLMFELRKGF
jgi:cation:H+ antiporter